MVPGVCAVGSPVLFASLDQFVLETGGANNITLRFEAGAIFPSWRSKNGRLSRLVSCVCLCVRLCVSLSVFVMAQHGGVPFHVNA